MISEIDYDLVTVYNGCNTYLIEKLPVRSQYF
jgi:hypothetical protein